MITIDEAFGLPEFREMYGEPTPVAKLELFPILGENILDSGILLSARRIVTLLELLRLHAELYVRATKALIGRAISSPSYAVPEEQADVFTHTMLALYEECTAAGLPVTADALADLIRWLAIPSWWNDEGMRRRVADKSLEAGNTLESELSHRVFFQIQQGRVQLFNEPLEGWKDAIDRFPDIMLDVEESARCFALSRYAASVFHSVQVVELGLIHLGKFLGVKDPLSGWTAVTQELNRIIKTKWPDRTQFEKENGAFVEQMQGCAEALKNAWRNKISHAQGKLTLLTSEFVPDVAEEIRMATRAFMRRLAAEMPA